MSGSDVYDCREGKYERIRIMINLIIHSKHRILSVHSKQWISMLGCIRYSNWQWIIWYGLQTGLTTSVNNP